MFDWYITVIKDIFLYVLQANDGGVDLLMVSEWKPNAKEPSEVLKL